MTELTQLQCPNCGGYKVQVKKPYAPTKNNSYGYSILELSLAFLFCFFTLGLGLLIVVPLMISHNKEVEAQIKSGDNTSWKCTCSLCGYVWLWAPGTPLPPVTVRPDLIKAGEQKNRQDEEERQRLNND
jgi:hypothetical protein